MRTSDDNVTVNCNHIRMRVSNNDLLKYMWKKGVTWRFDLVNDFNYTTSSAGCRLSRLKKAGLIINDKRGQWVVTRRGEQRLVYLGVKL